MGDRPSGDEDMEDDVVQQRHPQRVLDMPEEEGYPQQGGMPPPPQGQHQYQPQMDQQQQAPPLQGMGPPQQQGGMPPPPPQGQHQHQPQMDQQQAPPGPPQHQGGMVPPPPQGQQQGGPQQGMGGSSSPQGMPQGMAAALAQQGGGAAPQQQGQGQQQTPQGSVKVRATNGAKMHRLLAQHMHQNFAQVLQNDQRYQTIMGDLQHIHGELNVVDHDINKLDPNNPNDIAERQRLEEDRKQIEEAKERRLKEQREFLQDMFHKQNAQEHDKFRQFVKSELDKQYYNNIQGAKDQQNPNKTVFRDKSGEIHCTEDPKTGMNQLEVKGNFSGVVRVPRLDSKGNEVDEDVIEYQNGKPVSVLEGREGACKVQGMDKILDQAKGIQVMGFQQQQHQAPPGPPQHQGGMPPPQQQAQQQHPGPAQHLVHGHPPVGPNYPSGNLSPSPTPGGAGQQQQRSAAAR